MAEKIYIGNRIVTKLSDSEKVMMKDIKEKTTPTNKEITRILQLILSILTEEGGEG